MPTKDYPLGGKGSTSFLWHQRGNASTDGRAWKSYWLAPPPAPESCEAGPPPLNQRLRFSRKSPCIQTLNGCVPVPIRLPRAYIMNGIFKAEGIQGRATGSRGSVGFRRCERVRRFHPTRAPNVTPNVNKRSRQPFGSYPLTEFRVLSANLESTIVAVCICPVGDDKKIVSDHASYQVSTLSHPGEK